MISEDSSEKCSNSHNWDIDDITNLIKGNVPVKLTMGADKVPKYKPKKHYKSKRLGSRAFLSNNLSEDPPITNDETSSDVNMEHLQQQLQVLENENVAYKLNQEKLNETIKELQKNLAILAQKTAILHKSQPNPTPGAHQKKSQNVITQQPSTSAQAESARRGASQRDWRTVSSRYRNKSTDSQPTASIRTHNQFDNLSDSDDLEELPSCQFDNHYKTVNSSSPKSTPNIVNSERVDTTNNIDEDNGPGSLLNSPKPKFQKPIVSYKLNVKEFGNALRTKLNHNNFQTNSVNRNCTLIKTYSLSDYATAKELLSSMETSHFSYTPNELKPINVVIKKIDSSFNDMEVAAALGELPNIRVDVLKVFRPHVMEGSLPSKHWIVQCGPQTEFAKLFQTQFLLNSKIIIEKQNKTSIIQCRRCQRFGHAATNCNMPYRCVKCDLAHGPGECLITLECNMEESHDGTLTAVRVTEPICVNCNGNHPASFRECPKFKAAIENRKQKLLEAKQTQKKRQEHYQNFVKKGISYSNKVSGGQYTEENSFFNNNFPVLNSQERRNDYTAQRKNHLDNMQSSPRPHEEQNAINILNEDCENMFGSDIFTLLSKMKQFAPSYIKISNPEQRQKALSQFLLKLALNS